jgi:hypothetical protein
VRGTIESPSRIVLTKIGIKVALRLILLFDPGGAILPSRPLTSFAVARNGGQGWPLFAATRRACP